MTHTGALNSQGLMTALRAVAAALLAGAVIALAVILAAFVTMAALIVAAVSLAGAGAWWLYAKVRGRTRPRKDPRILEAHRGPHGWTVDGDTTDRR
ncbi:hypothetical protein F1654_04860 [Alkalicaulis satelles]|uniref:Uncharacterized protein n=1 Tax=Alkalicaulis satelles TaxID=2609175 RepID=A0A5M6ZKE9_9PROT|nr:hypothetical protein [Alkalicaulis satelles]KAA5805312.1 hypothetical protein F1654_04860 [Alkalicaulis satelles]